MSVRECAVCGGSGCVENPPGTDMTAECGACGGSGIDPNQGDER